MFGGIPQRVVLGDLQRVGRRFRTRQRVFLKRFSLRIKVPNLSRLKFGKPNRAVNVDLDAAWTGVRRWRLPLRYLEGFRVHFSDFPVRHKFCKPAISVLVEREAVSGRDFLDLRELLRSRIEDSEGASGRPDSSLRIDAQRVLGSAGNRPFFTRSIRILVFSNLSRRGIPMPKLVRSLLG